MSKLPNYEELQKLYDQLNNKGGSGDNSLENFLKVEEGKPVYIRILPAKNDEDLWYAKTVRHDFKLGKDFNYVQSRTIIGEECPLTNFYYELWNEHEQYCLSNRLDPKNKDIHSPYKEWARALKPKDRFFINVVSRADESKVKILSCTEALMNKIISSMLAKEPDGSPSYGNIVDLDTGHDFQIILSKGKNNFLNYNESSPSPKSKKAGTKEQIKMWMENLHDLNALVKPASQEEMLDIISKVKVILAKQMEEFNSHNVTSSRAGKLAAAME